MSAPGSPAGDRAAWPGPLDGDVAPMKWAEVDPAALAANAAMVCAAVAPRVEVMAMVKANGYGHGAVLAARAFLEGGCTRLGVSSAEEAVQLRRAGFDAPLLVTGWTHPQTHALLCALDVEVAVFQAAAVRSMAAAAARTGRRQRVHLKVDTGMNRQGVRAEGAKDILDAVAAMGADLELAGVFTHFADADGADPAFTLEQNERFLHVAERVRSDHPSVLVHAANSAAALRFPQTRHDAVRCGIVLYGYPPEHCGGIVAVVPAMTVAAWVTHVTEARAGETVGYNRTWRAAADTRLAVVAAGYGDGIQRSRAARGHVVVRGRLAPIVGRISMDQVSLDVSEIDGVVPGDRAVLLGPGLDAETVAAEAGTNSYEVLCAVSARVPRRVVEGAGPPPPE